MSHKKCSWISEAICCNNDSTVLFWLLFYRRFVAPLFLNAFFPLCLAFKNKMTVISLKLYCLFVSWIQKNNNNISRQSIKKWTIWQLLLLNNYTLGSKAWRRKHNEITQSVCCSRSNLVVEWTFSTFIFTWKIMINGASDEKSQEQNEEMCTILNVTAFPNNRIEQYVTMTLLSPHHEFNMSTGWGVCGIVFAYEFTFLKVSNIE